MRLRPVLTILLLTAVPMSATPVRAKGWGKVLAPQKPVYTGVTPRSFTLADFNGDDVPDLVVHDDGTGSISILEGLGGGSFGPPQKIGEAFIAFLAAADFDNDGRQDLFSTNTSPDLSVIVVHLGQGDGSFVEHWGKLMTRTGAAYPVIDDLDDDGNLDLAFVRSILLGAGDGTFTDHHMIIDDGAARATGDFDGDGIMDLAGTTSGRGMDGGFVSLGVGDGTFLPESRLETGAFPTSLAVGDFDGDGNPDLAISTILPDAVSIFLGLGDGTFEPPRSVAVGTGPIHVIAVDLDQDGAQDLAVANFQDLNVANFPSRHITILPGLGDGTFDRPRHFKVGKQPFHIAAADLDGDNAPDLVVASRDQIVSVLMNRGGTPAP